MPAPAVRVSVVGTRRADLVLPGAVPVAELLPILAGETLDPEERYAGCRLLLPDGRMLDPEAGVVAQGVRDGAVLSVVAGVEPPPPPAYDDAAEAMTEAVSDVTGWAPGSGAALAAAGLAILVSALAAATLLAGDRDQTALAGILVAAVLAPPASGTLALTSTRTGTHRWDEPVDARRIAADAALARRRLLMLLGVSGALLVVLAPIAAGSGRWGPPLAVAACAVTALRTRRQRAAADVLIGLVAGGIGLLATAVMVLLVQPAARAPVAISALVGALLLIAVHRRAEAATLWWGRVGDALESLAVLALLPLLALEAGLVPGVAS